MRRTFAAIAAASLLLLAGCSSAPSSAAPATTSTAASAVDRTAELQALVADVESATETEPGRLEVKTTLVDPRDDGGSDIAAKAIAVCEAAVTLGASYVSVLESDGTTFVLYGHPSYGEVCAEV